MKLSGFLLSILLVLGASRAGFPGAIKLSSLAEELLYGDAPTRQKAIEKFNKLPMDAQYKLVPDFMVALSDEKPEVRKVAGRILKAMGVKTNDQLPDAKGSLAEQKKSEPAAAPTVELTDISKEKENIPALPALSKPVSPVSAAPAAAATPVRSPSPSAEAERLAIDEGLPDLTSDRQASIAQLRQEKQSAYADLRQELEKEKRGPVTLNASDLRGGDSSNALSVVLDSLKDPDPWVHIQAARRLGMIRPAPVEAIPTLVAMLKAPDSDSRKAAAAALGSFGPLASDAAGALSQALNDDDNTVRQIAAEALRSIRQIP